MPLDAVPDAIRAAASAAQDLAGQIGAIPLPTVATSAETALPGAQSAAAAGALADAWRSRIDRLSHTVDDHAVLLRDAADHYIGQEQGTTQNLRATTW